MISQSMKKLIRPLVQRLHAYVPGEQPRIAGLIKLNTNENPYPPSPGVLRAVKAAVDGRLRLYPNPTAQALRERLAKLHKCGVENIIVGNGSDELLAMALRAFVEPARGRVQWFSPSYSLYPVIAKQHGARLGSAALESDFSLPSIPKLRKIIATRTRLRVQLGQLGFGVLPSESNFIFARTPRFPASEWFAKLRKRKILVRWFDSPATRDYLRITIGTDAEARTVVRAAKDILR